MEKTLELKHLKVLSFVNHPKNLLKAAIGFALCVRVCLCVNEQVCQSDFGQLSLEFFSSRHTSSLPDKVPVQATAQGKLLWVMRTMDGLKQSTAKVWRISRCCRLVHLVLCITANHWWDIVFLMKGISWWKNLKKETKEFKSNITFERTNRASMLRQ